MSPKPSSRPTQDECKELARLLPAPAERDLPGGRHQLLKDHLMSEIRHDIAEPSSRTAPQPVRDKSRQRKRLAWRLGLPLAVLAAAGGTVAAVVISTAPAPAADPTSVDCAPALSRDYDGSVSVPVEHGETPEQACAKDWKDFSRQLPGDDTYSKTVPAHLVGCTSPKGDRVVTVYPRPENMTDEQACTSVGQVLPDDGPVYAGATAAQVRKLQHLVNSRLGAEGAYGDGCAPYKATRAAVQEALDELGMDRWRIDDQRGTRSDTAEVWYFLNDSAGTVVLREGPECAGSADERTGQSQ